VVFQRKNSHVLFSARRADFKVRCNEMLEFAVRGIGVAGGHIPAAAGSANAKHLKKIKKRIVEYLLQNFHNNVNK
ncbi:MAG: hypothetical protein J7L14_03225, partial [Candidatus Diapherotrites archaeon]|nr:hypothetical protein [Candidatus Diapherotrites archaeon]